MVAGLVHHLLPFFFNWSWEAALVNFGRSWGQLPAPGDLPGITLLNAYLLQGYTSGFNKTDISWVLNGEKTGATNLKGELLLLA